MAISTIRSHAIRFRMRVRPTFKWNALRAAHRKALASLLAELKKTIFGKGKHGSTRKMQGAVQQIAGKLAGNRALEAMGRVERKIGKVQVNVGKASNAVRDMVRKAGNTESLA